MHKFFRLAVCLTVLCLSLSECLMIFGEPYNWNDPVASKWQQTECRKHCRAIETDRGAGMCSLSCTSLYDPWYTEEHDRRTMPDAELLAHGMCRRYDKYGGVVINPFLGEAELYHAIDFEDGKGIRCFDHAVASCMFCRPFKRIDLADGSIIIRREP